MTRFSSCGPLLVMSLLFHALPALCATTIDLPCDLQYHVLPQFNQEHDQLKVTVRGSAPANGVLDLAIAPEWAGVSNFADAIGGLHHAGTPRALVQGAVSLKVPSDKPFEVQYQLATGVLRPDDDVRRDHRDSYRNHIGAGWAQVFGYGAWLIPSHLAQRTDLKLCVDVSYDAPSLANAPSVTVASSFNAPLALHATKPVHRIVELTGSPLTLQNALYVFAVPRGDTRLLTRTVTGGTLSFALRGKWPFTDDAFADAAKALVLAHRDFFADHNFSNFLIALAPNGHEQGNFGGTAVRETFAMHASKSFDIGSDAFNFLIGHEHLHTWMPDRFGGMGEDEARRYWFSEGFTNFLTHRLLLKAGAFDLARYGQSLNKETVAKLATSPVATVDNNRVVADFFKSEEVGKLPYLRGELLALRWDAMLRKAGKPSLARILQGLMLKREEMVARETSGTSSTGAVPRLVAALQAQGIDAQRDIDQFIERGTPIPLAADMLGPCFQGTPTRINRFELGFDMGASQAAMKVVGLMTNSAAAKAGVQEGDPLRGFSVHMGSTSEEASVSVLRDGKVETIRFLPVSSDSIASWSFAVKADAMTDASCRQWITL